MRYFSNKGNVKWICTWTYLFLQCWYNNTTTTTTTTRLCRVYYTVL